MLRTLLGVLVCTALGVLVFKVAAGDFTIAAVLGSLVLLGFLVWRHQG
jgi:hypothetical protein